MNLLQARGAVAWLCGAVALNLGLTLFTGLVTLKDFPNSADEYSYYLSGLLLSEGRFSVPSPEPRSFFDLVHVVNDGRYFGKYTPGWPLLLAGGFLAGVPWVVAPLLGAGVLVLLHRLALEQFSEPVARMTVALAAANPFLIFNAASYFSHVPALFCVTACLYCYFRVVRHPGSLWPMVGLGLSAGFAVLVRPWSAVGALTPTAVLLLYRALDVPPRLDRWRELIAALIPFAACLGFLLYYNHALTGDPFRTTYSFYHGGHDTLPIGRQPGSFDWSHALKANLVDRTAELTRWVPLSTLVLLVFVMRPQARRLNGVGILAASAASLYFAYFLFFWPEGNRYGPRYVFELLGPLLVLMALALNRLHRAGWALAALIVVLNVALLASESRRFAEQVRARSAVFEAARSRRLVNAIVFIAAGAGGMPVGDLVRNGIRFDGSVIFVHDRGEENHALLERFPGRVAYVYQGGTDLRPY